MRIKFISLLFICCSLCSMLSAREKIAYKTPLTGFQTEAIVGNIEATYDYYLPMPYEHFKDSGYVKAEKAIQKYLKVVKDVCDMADVEEEMYERILDDSRKEYGEEEVIRHSSMYLMCGWNLYAHIAYQAMANAYATLQKKDNLRYVLHCFEHSDINQNGKYNPIIAQMRNDMASILHPTDINAMAKGVWVSDVCTNRKKYYSFPYSILEIRSLTDDGTLSLSLPSFDNRLITPKGQFSNFRMAQGVAYDEPNANTPGRISAIFSSQHFQQGINTSSGFEQTRQFQANMQSKIASSKGSFGQQMGATVATAAVAGVMNMALMSMAQSYQSVATMTVNLQPQSEDIMSGHMRYIYHTFSTMNPDEVIEPIYDDKVNFIRWLPEDTICFINQEKQAYNPYGLYLDKGAEIVKKYSWRNPKWSGPLAACIIGGLGMYGGGMGTALSSGKNHAKFLGGLATAAIGALTVIIAPSTIAAVRSKKQKAAIQQFNENQLETLRKKRSASISIAPSINPYDASAGLSVGVTY